VPHTVRRILLEETALSLS